MEQTLFYFYEKEVLWSSVQLFAEHFKTQVELALAEKDVLNKKELISDIEYAVHQMISIFQDIVDSSANSDRQMFMNLAVDTSIYVLSPKLCMYYSSFLKKIVEIFDSEAHQYAFVLHPCLQSVAKTEALFEQRKRHGKVVVVRIPESSIELVDIIPIYLLHETFHVITKEERLRRARAVCFIQHILLAIKEALFRGICLNEEIVSNVSIQEIKETLMEKWFAEIVILVKKMPQMDERDFYSKKISAYVVYHINNCLININNTLAKDVEDALLKNMEAYDYSVYQKYYFEASGLTKGIRKNLYTMIITNKVEDYADLFMNIYREVYADMAMILTLSLSPSQYEQAFANSISFKHSEAYVDYSRSLRNLIVANCVYNKMENAQLQKEWEKYGDGLVAEHKIAAKKPKDENEGLQKCNKYDNISITSQMIGIYQEHFEKCSGKFANRIASIPGENKNKLNNIREIIQMEKKDLFKCILSGDMHGKFENKNSNSEDGGYNN